VPTTAQLGANKPQRKENEMQDLRKSQVRVSTRDFRFAHGKSPRGLGGWFFEFGNVFVERAPRGSFTEAKAWAVNRAVQLGTTSVEVCS